MFMFCSFYTYDRKITLGSGLNPLQTIPIVKFLSLRQYVNTFLQMTRTRSVFFWVGLLLLTGLVLLTLSVNFDAQSMGQWFVSLSKSPLAIPATLLIYTLTAFVSAPQWMLHGASVLAFGPVFGAVIAWCATMISASFDFWLGRRLGAKRVQKLTGGLVGKLLDVVQNHGFWTSLIVRIVPTGPFVVVNMAAGVTRMKFWSFFAGTAIGIIPKIATIAFFGEGVGGAINGRGPMYVGVIIAIAILWIGIIYFAGAKLKSKSQSQATDNAKNQPRPEV